MTHPPGPEWSRLSAALAGEVLRRPDAVAAAEPQVLERFRDVRPTAVVRCADADDVATAVRLLHGTRQRIVVRSGGHDFAGRSTTTDVVLDVSALQSVVLDGERARIGAGTQLGAVYRALGERGRTIPAGCGPDVAVSGLTLGGGLGVLGRRHGLTCDSLVAAEVVLADGSRVRCDTDRHADLFWALRGAGACGFGVVTGLEFATVAAPDCQVVRLTWPFAAAAEVLDVWQRWSPDASDGVALSLLLNASGDTDREPTVTVFGAVAEANVDEVNDLINGFVTAVGHEPADRLIEAHDLVTAKQRLAELGPGEDGGAGHLHSDFFGGTLPRATVDQLVAVFAAERVPGEARELDLSPWAGVYNRPAPDETAFCHRDARSLLKHTATVPVRSGPPGPWLDASWQTVREHATGGVYPNFPDPTLSDPGRAYWGDNLDRVRRVKEHYDPDGMFGPPVSGRRADAAAPTG